MSTLDISDEEPNITTEIEEVSDEESVEEVVANESVEEHPLEPDPDVEEPVVEEPVVEEPVVEEPVVEEPVVEEPVVEEPEPANEVVEVVSKSSVNELDNRVKELEEKIEMLIKIMHEIGGRAYKNIL